MQRGCVWIWEEYVHIGGQQLAKLSSNVAQRASQIIFDLDYLVGNGWKHLLVLRNNLSAPQIPSFNMSWLYYYLRFFDPVTQAF